MSNHLVNKSLMAFAMLAGALTSGIAEAGCQSEEVSGVININPNNNATNEFTLWLPDGTSINRDDLHQQANVDEDGTLYAGDAVRLRVKPKGNESQSQVTVGGEPYVMNNAETYILEGEMVVRVYNTHVKNGKAMGKWYIELDGSIHVQCQDLEIMYD